MTHNICIENGILDIGKDEKYYYEVNKPKNLSFK